MIVLLLAGLLRVMVQLNSQMINTLLVTLFLNNDDVLTCI